MMMMGLCHSNCPFVEQKCHRIKVSLVDCLLPSQPTQPEEGKKSWKGKKKKTGFLQEILLCLLNWQVCCGKHPRGLAKEVTNFREPCSERQRGTLEKWDLFRWCVQNDVFFLPPAAGWLAGHCLVGWGTEIFLSPKIF